MQAKLLSKCLSIVKFGKRSVAPLLSSNNCTYCLLTKGQQAVHMEKAWLAGRIWWNLERNPRIWGKKVYQSVRPKLYTFPVPAFPFLSPAHYFLPSILSSFSFLSLSSLSMNYSPDEAQFRGSTLSPWPTDRHWRWYLLEPPHYDKWDGEQFNIGKSCTACKWIECHKPHT